MRRALLLVALALVGCGSSEVGDTGLIRWTVPSECADGLLITGDSIIVVSPEVVARFDLDTGRERWAATMSDTSGAMPVLLVDDVVVVAPEYEDVQAFRYSDGSPTDVPGGVDLTPPVLLPAGYDIDQDGVLRYEGQAIWEDPTPMFDPGVGRLGELTVINDDDDAQLLVVDDAGEVRLRRQVEGQDCYSPVATGEGVAATTTVLGELVLLGLNPMPGDEPSEQEPSNPAGTGARSTESTTVPGERR